MKGEGCGGGQKWEEKKWERRKTGEKKGCFIVNHFTFPVVVFTVSPWLPEARIQIRTEDGGGDPGSSEALRLSVYIAQKPPADDRSATYLASHSKHPYVVSCQHSGMLGRIYWRISGFKTRSNESIPVSKAQT